MKALITGGGGFVGGSIARFLRDRGDNVIALGRSDYAHLREAGIETVRADIRDAAALVEAFKGMDGVFHVAAHIGIWGAWRDFWDTNVEGTRNVIDACKRNGVSKLIFTSTPSVVFGTGDLCGVDESQPYPDRYLTAYAETKAMAERMVLQANSPGLATAALRPHLVWGPGDPHLIPRILDRARNGRLVQVGDGTNLVDVTYIDNVVQAHNALADALSPDARCAGKPYFISQGEPVRLWPWLNDLLERLGMPPVRRRIGYRTTYAAGWLIERIWAITRRRSEPRMTRFVATQFAKSHYFDISAARADFGYDPSVSTAEGVDRLVAALKAG